MVAPSCMRESFLQATENDDRDAFVQFLQRHHAKHDEFTIEEVLQSLSHKQYDRLWAALNQMSIATLLNSPFESVDDESENKLTTATTKTHLQAVVTVATCCLSMEKPLMNDHMLETAIILHGVVLDLPESASKLQQGIAKLCEKWWINELSGKEELVANTLMFYLVRSLQPTAMVADVNSVDGLRQALKHVNMDDDSSATLKDLLEQCVVRPNYLKQKKGRRFLSFLFTVNTAFTERLHKAIKMQLPFCSRSLVSHYGEVYFKAWRVSTGPFVEQLENSCIQDFMYHAVHASRPLASRLRQLLGYFKENKRQQGVDKMLLALYEPIIWRAVKVANASVRANAAALMIDAFPLQNPDSNKEECDMLMQKQFDILQDLLDDPCPVVRVTGIQGVCNIASVFWELIPADTLEAFLTKLIREMAFDVSTPDIRVAVFRGLKSLLDNHLSHPILKTLLPVLRDFIHDSSERVRVAFVEILLKVKGLRTIKYWSITPMEHLLAQLVEDSAPVARRLVSLLFNSLLPTDQTGEIQLERCITLIQTNPAAVRVLYQYASRHMSVASAGQFLMILGHCLLSCVRAAQPVNGGNPPERDPTTPDGDGSEGEAEEKENERSREEHEGSLTLKDVDIVEGMLEIIAVLWTGIADQLSKPENQTVKKKLISRFSKALPEFLTVFQEGRALSAVLVIAGYLPSASIPSFSRGCLSTLKSMSSSATPADYGPLLECLVSWGHGSDVLELISDWLTDTLVTSPPAKKTCKKVSFKEPTKPRPSLALTYMDWLLSRYASPSAFMSSRFDQLHEITNVLKKTILCLEQRLMTFDHSSDLLTDPILVKSLEMYCRLSIHLTAGCLVQQSQTTSEVSASTALTELIAWADREIIPMMKKAADATTDVADRPDYPGCKLQDLGKEILKIILSLSSEAIMLGTTDKEFQAGMADFSRVILTTVNSVEYLPLITRNLYQMAQQQDGDSIAVEEDSALSSFISDIIQALSRMFRKEQEDGKSGDKTPTFLTEIKPAVSEVLKTCHRRHHQSATSLTSGHDNVVATVMAAVVAEVTHHVQGMGLEFCCSSIGDLPTLSHFLLGMIGKTHSMLCSFLRELEQCTSSGILQLDGLLASLHILRAISQDEKMMEEMKACVAAISCNLEKLQKVKGDILGSGDSDSNTDTALFNQASVMTQDILKTIEGQT